MEEQHSACKTTQSRRSFLGRLASSFFFLRNPRLLWAVGSTEADTAELGSGQATFTQAGWLPKAGPLMTRWSSQVDPALPHPEYPRPQLVRKDWMNLNGVWEYQPGLLEGEAAPFGKTLSSHILVPYPIESALSGVMEHHDRLWYRRSIQVPRVWRGQQILLHFGAVDYESEVFLNGKRVGEHRGGYDPFHYDITPFLSGGAIDELIVRVFDPTEKGGQPRGKQNTQPRGITYTPTTGIWQTVWLEPVNAACLEELSMVPDIDSKLLKLTVNSTQAPAGDVDIEVKAGETSVARTSVRVGQETAIPIPNPKLWSPETPFLYNITLQLRQKGAVVDRVSSYFGMRKVSVGDVAGQKKLFLNNQPVFQIGPLDQGFWPDGIYTAPTDDALKEDIVQMKAMGFNFVRKHIKVEPARWYYWADTLGLMIWQDAPSCNSYPGRQFTPPPVDKAAFEDGLRRMVQTHRNAPSIVMWVVFNEAQGQFETEKMVSLVHELDPSRLVNEASGGEIHGAGDVNDIHSYPEPAVRPSNGKQAMVCGEFGGIGYLIPEHSWQREGHGYVESANADDLLYLYAEYFEQVRSLRDTGNLSAVVYTELTDVMTEVNGLLTYDRVPKLPVEQIRRVNSFEFKAPDYKVLVPTSATNPQVWKYTLSQPGEAWLNQDFDDSKWQEAPAPFGDFGRFRTKWTGPELWLRRPFDPGALTAEELQAVVMSQFNRGRVEIYINGVQTFAQQGNNRSTEGSYEHRPLSTPVRQAIVPNENNMLAVHCHTQPAGGPLFFDAGLSVRLSSLEK